MKKLKRIHVISLLALSAFLSILVVTSLAKTGKFLKAQLVTTPTCSSGQIVCYPENSGAGYCHTGTACPAYTNTTTVSSCASGQNLCYTASGSSYCQTGTCPSVANTTTTTMPTCSSGQMTCWTNSGSAYCHTGTSCPINCTSNEIICYSAMGNSYCYNGSTCPSNTTTTMPSCSSGQIVCYSSGSSMGYCHTGTTCPTTTTSTTTTTTTSTTTPVTTTTASSTPGSCPNGEICASGYWCSGAGMSCYYPDGRVTCKAWSTGIMPAPTTCDAGTSSCNPTDTSCWDPSKGEVTYSSSNYKWCSNSTSYYKDGKMKCFFYNETPGSDWSNCSPTDTKCIPNGKKGPKDGYCSNGTSCFEKKDDGDPNNDQYCMAYSNVTGAAAMTMSSPVCPSEYKSCRPDSPGCREIGESWTVTTTSDYCTNGKICYGATNTCIDWNGTCPAGSTKTCSPTSTDCIENGETKEFKITSSSTPYPWCGSGGMTVYSNITATSFSAACVPMAANSWNDPNLKLVLPSGGPWKFCRPENNTYNSSSKCREPGEKLISTGDWCGYNKPGNYMSYTAGTVCPSIDSTTVTTPPPPPPEPVCTQILTQAYNPTTYECREFKNSCEVLPGWIPGFPPNGICGGKVEDPLIVDPVCSMIYSPTSCPVNETLRTKPSKDGCSYSWCEPNLTLDKNQCKDYLNVTKNNVRGHKYFIRDLERQLREIESTSETIVYTRAVVKTAKALADAISEELKTVKSCDTAAFQTVKEKINDLEQVNMPALYESQNAIRIYSDCNFFRQDLKRNIEDISRYGSKVNGEMKEYQKDLEKLLEESKTVCAEGDEFALQDLRFEWEDIQFALSEIFENMHFDHTNNYLYNLWEEFNRFILEAKSKGLEKDEFKGLISKAENLLFESNEALKSGNFPKAGEIFDKLQQLKEPIIFALKNAGYNIAIGGINVSDALVERLSNLLNEKLELFINNTFKDKITVLIEEATQNVLTKIADIKLVSEQALEASARAVANLEAVAEEKRNEINKNKEDILVQAKEIETKLQTIALKNVAKGDILKALEIAMTTNWCGEAKRTAVVNNTQAMLRALEAEGANINAEESTNYLVQVEKEAKDNTLSCFQLGITPFKDAPTEAYYFTGAKNTHAKALVTGYKDANGRPTGELGIIDPTLRGEALTMFVRLLNLPVGDSQTLVDKNVTGAVSWMVPYINAATNYGINVAKFGRMDQPISRLDSAYMMSEFLQKAGDITIPTQLDLVKNFKDYGKFSTDSFEKLLGAEVMAQYGIMKGNDDGTYRSYDNLIRADFVTLIDRVDKTFME